MSTVAAKLDELRERLRASNQIPEGVELIVVFGSVARDRPRPDSDLDVAVLGGGFWALSA
ncbi:MAG: nucleotidyltransferase domain-containing protein [Proteobacteria bacterium]|nr:nucleotidyltransferase domain-containing protein [Pseudomonadota bacterium]